MSITPQEAQRLVDVINSTEDLTHVHVASYIRRAIRTKVTEVHSQKNLLIYMIDFSKPTMIVTLSRKERYKKTLFCIVKPGLDCEDSSLDNLIELVLTNCLQMNLYGNPLLIFLSKYSDDHRIKFHESFKDSLISTFHGMKDLLLARDPFEKAQYFLMKSDKSVEFCPFSYIGPCQPSMFFGRKTVIRDILFNTQKGYAITGGRRIGKTSLLLKLRNDIENNRYPQLNFKAIYIDCSTFSNFQELIAEITRKLSPKYYYHKGSNYSFTLLETLKRETSLRNKKLFLLLDEMDDLIIKVKKQSVSSDKFFNSLRSTINENGVDLVHLIISGFRQVSKLISDNNLSLFNLCESIILGQLTSRDIRDLFYISFKSAGIEIEKKNAFLSIVMDMTSGHPSFAQFIAKKLFKERKGNVVNLKQLEGLYNDRSIMDYILDHFTMNTNSFERFICLLMINKPSFSYEDVFNSLLSQPISKQDVMQNIHQALRNLAMNSILVEDAHRYKFLNKLVIKTILTNFPPQTFIPALVKEV